jgi:hypothetical protein
VISPKLLFALNDYDSAETIRTIADQLESGVIEIRSNGDAIESLCLSDYGESLWPPPILPATKA